MATMNTIEKPVAGSAQQDLIITRVFDAPRERVWKAWTEPEQVKKWWGPRDFTAPHIHIDLQAGGKYVYCMRGAGPDGAVRDYWGVGIYKEIVQLKRLVYTGSTLRSRPDRFKTEVARQLKEQVWPKIEAGAIKPKVDRTFALAQAADAHRLMESAQHFGKIILKP